VAQEEEPAVYSESHSPRDETEKDFLTENPLYAEFPATAIQPHPPDDIIAAHQQTMVTPLEGIEHHEGVQLQIPPSLTAHRPIHEGVQQHNTIPSPTILDDQIVGVETLTSTSTPSTDAPSTPSATVPAELPRRSQRLSATVPAEVVGTRRSQRSNLKEKGAWAPVDGRKKVAHIRSKPKSHRMAAIASETRKQLKTVLGKPKVGAFRLTVKKALELLGDDAAVSILKEMTQLHDRGTFAIPPDGMITPALARKILPSSTFLKEKHTAEGLFLKLKSRLVAGGHMQDRELYTDSGSPTASTTSVYLVAGIAARENRAVATVDFPSAYLHAELPSDGPTVLMRIGKYETEVLCKLDPDKYRSHVRKDGTLVVQLKKGLYGLVQSARLWYNKLSSELKELGFTVNAYDECVFNRTESDGSQTTLVLHVDDVLVTAKSEKQIDTFLSDIKMIYKELEVHRGKEHDYLGMHFSWKQEGKCIVTMPGYIEDVITFSSAIPGTTASTPAGASLFEVSEESKLLDTEKQKFFHSLTAKLLYLAKRARPDLLLAVSFLARRVQCPTEQDQKKLYRALRYLRGTTTIGMILEPNTVLQAYGWVDASFAVHADYKSHTGAIIGIGKGPFWAKSTTQRLNSKSSTEAELIGATDSAGQLIWTRSFLEDQGYNVGPAILYQDNMSTIALLKNGKSNSERTRHIAIRYYFLKDRIDNKEVAVEYLATGDMIADILTKPLQGEQFLKLRAQLLNWP
jgi:hypothetical protein